MKKKKGVFKGESMSPLLFVLSMVPLSLILRKVNACTKERLQAKLFVIYG